MKSIIFENCYLIEFPKLGDNNRGFLTAFEINNKFLFAIKRIYYIYEIGDLQGIRGPHAHKQTQQIFFTLNGKAKYHLDNGIEKKEITIDKPNIGIFIGPKIWHYINDFSVGIIFLVVASTYYDENDYLRNYDQFLDYNKHRL